MTTLSCYNFDVREPIFIIFDRIATQKVNDQKYFVFPPHLASASAVPGKTQKHKIASFTQMLLYCASCWLNLFSLVTCNSYFSAVWFPKTRSGRNEAMDFYGYIAQKIKWRVLRCSSWDCWMHWCTVLLKKKTMSSRTRIILSNICWDSKISPSYPSNTVHWFSPQAWWRTTPIFDTATATVTDLVNVEHEGFNILLGAMLPS